MSSVRESRFLSNNNDLVICAQEIRGKKWKLESLFRIASCIFYGFFFGMLPASFKFSSPSSDYIVEITSIIGLLAIALMSIMVIYWTFKGDIRKHLYVNYYIVHMMNALLLSVGVLVLAFFPISFNSNIALENVRQRQFILMICLILWSIFMSLILLFSFMRVKKLFPLSWSKIVYSQLIFVITGLMHVLFFLAAVSEYNGKSDNTKIFLILSLLTYVLATILFVFALSYIKVYRDILLGERTDFEIRAIKDWEDAKILSIIVSTVASIVFIFSLTKDKIQDLNIFVYIEIAVDAIFILLFLLISLGLRLVDKNTSKLLDLVKSIDYILMLEVFVWIILVKTTVIQGICVSVNQNLLPSEITSFYISAAIAFGSIALLYIIAIVMSINIPNLRNVAMSISSVVASILLALFTLTFTTTFAIPQLELTQWLPLFMLLTMVLGTTISLVLRVFDVSKIFKSSSFKYIQKNEVERNSNNDTLESESVDVDKFEHDYVVDISNTQEKL